MSVLDTTAPERADPPRGASAIANLIDHVRTSKYFVIGSEPRFRALQRRRTRFAARIGLLVIAGAVAFDAVALAGLDSPGTIYAIGTDLAVMTLALLGFWALGSRARHHPELVAWAATVGLAGSTVSTGTLVPSLAVQAVGYLLLIPGVVALLLPWRTQTHIRWLLAYGLVGFGYLSLGDLGRFTPDERGDLVIVLFVALGASLAGHVLLQRAQVTNFVQLGRIGRLRRKTESDLVELERLHHALELTARTDPLTGAGNRRRLDEDLSAVRAHIARSGFTYGIAEIDLDHFKWINDRSGHAAGDDVLRRVAQAIERSLRAEDAVYRLGGEEFLIILYVPNADGLGAAAERLRSVVYDLGIPHPDNPPHGKVSVSVGATFIGQADLDQTNDQWIARADAALYLAKGAGRNRISVEGAGQGG